MFVTVRVQAFGPVDPGPVYYFKNMGHFIFALGAYVSSVLASCTSIGIVAVDILSLERASR